MTGSIVGLLVFIGIGVVLYIDYTRRIIWFKPEASPVEKDTKSTKESLVVDENQDERNGNRYIETHGL